MVVNILSVFRTPTVLPLIVANVITIIMALFLNWSVLDVMLLYVIQSMIIGLFHFLKMLSASARMGKGAAGFGIILSLFYLVHYGMFHAVYLFFLIGFYFALPQNGHSLIFFSAGFLITIAVFVFNHLFSFLHYAKKSVNHDFSMLDISKMMFNPYLRIIPMHITIIFGGMFLFLGIFNWAVLLLFMVLKTVVDVKMHLTEHKDELI